MAGLQRITHECDVCVIGGGLAGLCAAIAAARHGARTILMHDRPVFGGNASSEVRMWICGAQGRNNRETGILEEIQLENLSRNPSLDYSIWDSVLWSKVHFQPNLQKLMNCSCLDADTQDGRIVSVTGWQLTTQQFHTVKARLFIDCSGDSILAPLSGAAVREGREAAGEFNEDIEPPVADSKRMGHSLLIQMHRTDEPQPFTAPEWAYKITDPDDVRHRVHGINGTNFWWIEIGGLHDTIADTELLRDELVRLAYGVWDYIKNHAPERDKAANWAIHWIGMLPGKRESRRYVGDHILTQNDIEAQHPFEDVVAFGGWSMDDHHPAGLLYPDLPTIHHPAPSPYRIPLRSLYSQNIANLMMAGRNISVTHAALSSTRVMATCAVLGQAAGTAAAFCARLQCSPRQLGRQHLLPLQQALMLDDCFLPGMTRPMDPLCAQARLEGPGEVELLRNGMDRDRPEAINTWEGAVGDAITYGWTTPVHVGGVRLIFDSSLTSDKRMPCSYPQPGNRCLMPATLIRDYLVQWQDPQGQWHTALEQTRNKQRLVMIPIHQQATAVRLTLRGTWGLDRARVVSFEVLQQCQNNIPALPTGCHLRDLRAALNPRDLAPPAKLVHGKKTSVGA